LTPYTGGEPKELHRLIKDQGPACLEPGYHNKEKVLPGDKIICEQREMRRSGEERGPPGELLKRELTSLSCRASESDGPRQRLLKMATGFSNSQGMKAKGLATKEKGRRGLKATWVAYSSCDSMRRKTK